MTLTKNHKYIDQDGDVIEAQAPGDFEPEQRGVTSLIYLEASCGTYVEATFAAPLALNILGHDRPNDDPLATEFDVADAVAHIAHSQSMRDSQLNMAAALLMAIDGYDRREVRLATAETRRNEAAKSLTAAVLRLRLDAGADSYSGDDIGKLREALGRFDAALAN
jgi:hypothetical protein